MERRLASRRKQGRENDVLAFVIGQVIPSDDYKKANADSGRTEGHLELL